MEQTGATASGFEQRVLQSITALASTFDDKLGTLKDQIIAEQKVETERLAKKIKLEKKFEFRRKGNEVQHDFNATVTASLEEATSSIEKGEDLAKAKEALKEGLDLLAERQKLIKIADRSESGWLAAQEYMADEIADDSDDEKRIARAERQADKIKKKRASAKRGGAGMGRYSFREQRGRPTEQFFRPAGYERYEFGQSKAPAAGFGNAAPGYSRVGPCFMCGRMGHLRRDCPLQRLGSGAMGAGGPPKPGPK